MKILNFFFFIILVPLFLFGQKPINNIEWIEKNVSSIFDSLDIKESISNKNLKIDFGAVKGEKKGFIKSQILNYLNIELQDNKEESSINFHIEQFNTTIVYEQNSDGFLGFNTYYFRKNRIRFIGWIDDSANMPVKSFNINKVFSEKLDKVNLTKIETSPYSFSKGKIKDLSFWASTFEPILVGGSIAAIVYLFFSVRS